MVAENLVTEPAETKIPSGGPCRRPSIYLPFLLLSLFYNVALAQADWKKWYGMPSTDETFIAAEPGADDTYIWAAGTIANNTHNDIWLTRLDPHTGQLLWSDTLGDPQRNERLTAFIRNPATGEMWLAGDSQPLGFKGDYFIFLKKLDADGQVIFEKQQFSNFVADYNFSVSLQIVGDGVWLFNDSNGSLHQLDAQGNEIWQRSFATDWHWLRRSQNMATLPDGSGYLVENYPTADSCTLHRLDAAGQTLWSVTWDTLFYPEAIAVMADEADGSVFIALKESGWYRAVLKYAADGQLLWETEVPHDIVDNDFGKGWMLRLHAPADRLMVFSYNTWQTLDAHTGEFIEGEYAGFSFTSPFVSLNDAVLLADGTLAVVGTHSEYRNGYDGYLTNRQPEGLALLSEHTFGIPGPNDTDYSARCEQANDGGFYIANVTHSASTGIALRKTDAQGNELWKQTFFGPDTYHNFEMTRAADGSLFLAGWGNTEITLIKLDPTGSLLWETAFPSTGNVALLSCTAPLDNGGALVLNGGSEPKVIAFNANGTTLWEVLLPTLDMSNFPFLKAKDLSDGTIAVVGNPIDEAGILLQLDLETGAILLEKTVIADAVVHPGYFKDVFKNADGSFIVLHGAYPASGGARYALHRLDAQGNVTKSFDLPPLLTSFPYDRLTAGLFRTGVSDEYVASVTSPEGSGCRLDVFRVNENLELLDQNALTDLPALPRADGGIAGNNNHLLLPDGSFMLCDEGGHDNDYDVCLLKTGASGIVSAGQEVSDEDRITIFPNPLPGGAPLRVLLENDFFGTVKMKVFSPDGRRLQTLEVEKTERRQVFELKKLPGHGAFFVRISAGVHSVGRLVVRGE